MIKYPVFVAAALLGSCAVLKPISENAGISDVEEVAQNILLRNKCEEPINNAEICSEKFYVGDMEGDNFIYKNRKSIGLKLQFYAGKNGFINCSTTIKNPFEGGGVLNSSEQGIIGCYGVIKEIIAKANKNIGSTLKEIHDKIRDFRQRAKILSLASSVKSTRRSIEGTKKILKKMNPCQDPMCRGFSYYETLKKQREKLSSYLNMNPIEEADRQLDERDKCLLSDECDDHSFYEPIGDSLRDFRSRYNVHNF